MKRRIFSGLFLFVAVMALMPVCVLAASEAGNLPLPGDRFDMWLWVTLMAVGVIGFLVALFFLLVPTKRGKYERIEEKKKGK